ncbi:hybrid sensor histidine kinase/response regulator [Natronobeatus ordinarius]|uniref:hybrid sensor histidine kinase/response regulator n=1 Tax=Natronobeatus ordinarius TaxID=2963433 RepID=UPI0020CD31A6|nr:PAS domain S-box protein [Natronobeatus ordinarius]
MDRTDSRLAGFSARGRADRNRSVEQAGGPIDVVCADAERQAAVQVATELERRDDRLTAAVETDGRAVLERLESATVDCVVCGRELADERGAALLESVRKHDRYLPFVFVIDGADEAFVRETLSFAGTDHFRPRDGYAVLGNRVRNAVVRYRARADVDELRRGRALQDRLTRRLFRTAIDAELTTVGRDDAQIADAVHGAFDGYEPLVRIELARYDDRELTPLESADGTAPLLERLHDDPEDSVLAEAVRTGRPQVVCAGEAPVRSAHRHLDDGECLTILAVEVSREQYLLLAVVTESCGIDEHDLLAGIATEVAHAIHTTDLQSDLLRFRNAVEHAGHVVLITDETGTIEYVNPAFERVTGYDREAAVGRTPAMLSSGEHDEAFYADLWGTIRAGNVWRGEVINERADGSRYVIDQTIAPIENARGATVGFVAVNQNVTDQKARERDLAFLKRAVDQVGVGVATYEPDGRATYVNRRLAALVGTDCQDLEGRHVAEINAEVARDQLAARWEAFEEGETRLIETSYERLDTGEAVPVEVVSSRITIDDEPYQVATVRDVTERRRYERELKRVRSAVEHAGHGVVITDETGTIEYVNEAFEAMSGYSAAEAVGETPAILNAGVHDEAFFEALWETILAGEVWHGEVVNERPDGSHYVIDQTIAPLLEDGKPVGFVAINNDITDLKTYERELEEQNERLAQYGRMVAHDLRNPLTLLDAHVEATETVLEVDPETPVGELEADLRREFRDVDELTDYMRRLIENLLSMAEHGQLVLDAEETALEPVARTAWQETGTEPSRLVVDDGTIDADPERLRELLANLFRNAVEHAGPAVTVRVGPLGFGDGFFVADDGPGIPADEREWVLERGYTTADDGTGFGLAIVAQIAEGHEWTLAVTESEDGGVRFEFRA